MGAYIPFDAKTLPALLGSSHYLLYEASFFLYALVRLITGFIVIMAYFYISGRTQLSQMNSIDMIGNFTFGGIIGGAIYSDQGSFVHYLGILCLALIVLASANYVCRHIYLLRTIAIGHPIPIIRDGKFLMHNILKKANRVDMVNIASQLNAQGIYSFDEVYYAQVEPNGVVSAICDKDKLPSLVVIYKGRLYYDDLKNLGKEDRDILQDLKKYGIKELSDVYLGEYKNGLFKYVTNDGAVYPKVKKEPDFKLHMPDFPAHALY